MRKIEGKFLKMLKNDLTRIILLITNITTNLYQGFG